MTALAHAVPVEVMEAMLTEHRRVLGEARHEIDVLRSILHEHGINPPDHEDPVLQWNPDEHYAGCREIVRLAYDLVMASGDLAVLQQACERFRVELGTSKELIA